MRNACSLYLCDTLTIDRQKRHCIFVHCFDKLCTMYNDFCNYLSIVSINRMYNDFYN